MADADLDRLQQAYAQLQRQKIQIAELERSRRSPVAIIGQACRLPGAESPDEFFELLRRGRDAIRPPPPGRWPTTGDRAEPGGFIDAIGRIDPAFFGLSPREAARLHPQQTLVLESGWNALEDAGIDPRSLASTRTGVFLGISDGDRQTGAEDCDADIQRLTGCASSVASARLSYLLGLQGPSLAVDTACSASLVALHLAVRSLRLGETDLAIVGGVNALLDPAATAAFSAAGALASDGRCKTFDAAADGYVRSEGSAAVVLKRLADAIADGDRVLAVVLGSAVNQDGRTNGLLSPSGVAQQAVIRDALRDAGVSPAEVDFVEAHGTGTALGDPIELGALQAVFAGRERPLPVGAVKTNIGHLEAAAGLAGLIKAAFVVREGEIPANLHFERFNPHADLDGKTLTVPQAAMHLVGEPRIAGVSSFGFSGTNAHVIVAQPPDDAEAGTSGADSGARLLKVSARTDAALRALASRHANRLDRLPEKRLDAYCRTAAIGRTDFRHRLCVLGFRPDELAASLRSFSAGEAAGGCFAGAGGAAPRLAFLFTGQGAQRPGMGRQLFEEAPVFRDSLLRCEAILRADGIVGPPLTEILFSPGGELIHRTAYAQPALFSLAVALADYWRNRGVEPEVVIGHSTGEYAAAWCAGCFSLEDGLAMIARRARLIEEATSGGATAALFAPAEAVAALLADLGAGADVAAYNAPHETLIAGPEEAVAAALAEARIRGVGARRLALPYAPHSAMVAQAVDVFRREIAGVRFRVPEKVLVSNVTAGELESIDADYLCRQLREPVRFMQGMAAVRALGCDAFLEIGPEPVLQLLARQNWSEGKALWLGSLSSLRDDRREVLESAAALYAAGGAVDIAGVVSDFGRSTRKIGGLPTYPFDVAASHAHPKAFPPDREPAGAGADVAAELCVMFAGLMEIDRAEVEADVTFVEMGADSLLLGRLALEVRERYGVELTIGCLFERFDTLARLTMHVASASRLEVEPAAASRGRRPRIAVSAAARRTAPASPRLPVGTAGPTHPPARQLTPREQEHVACLLERFRAKTRRSAARYVEGRHRRVDTRLASARCPPLAEALYPIVGDRAEGALLRDLDGNRYVDITMGFGVLLCGHGPDFVRRALAEQIDAGVQTGPLARLADEVAEIALTLTGHERALLGLSGTASVGNALRIARAATGRQKFVMFQGSYHGQGDQTLGLPDLEDPDGAVRPSAPGISEAAVGDAIVLPYAKPSALEAIRTRAGVLAAVLVEPVQSRNPGLQPVEFLKELRDLTAELGVPLIFDEVITGFRVHPSGAQGLFGIRPDLSIYGKCMGGGLPVSMVAGSAALLGCVDGFGTGVVPGTKVEPTTPVGTTFDMQPLCMASARAMLAHLASTGPELQRDLNARAERLCERLALECVAVAAPIGVARFGSMFRFSWRGNISYVFRPLEMEVFYLNLLERGLYVWEGRTCFLSTAHTEEDMDAIVAIVSATLADMAAAGFFDGAETNAPAATSCERRAIGEGLPVTAGQARVLRLAARAEAGAPDWCVAERFRLDGRFDWSRFLAEAVAAVARHPALRTVFDPDARTQRVLPEVEPDARIVELDDADGDAIEACMDAVSSEALSEPFDLRDGPLFRIRAVSCGERTHVLLCCHHLVSDSWSLSLIRDEIAAGYSGIGEESGATGFCEVVADRAALRDAFAPAEAAAEIARRIDAPPLILPATGAAAPERLCRGRRLTRRLGLSGLAGVRAFARRHALTPFMSLHSAFCLHLHALTGADRLVCGVPRSARSLPGAERIVGYCADIVPVPSRVDPAWTVEDYLSRQREAVLDAFRLPDGMFEELLEAASPAGNGAADLPFATIFNLDPPVAPPRLDGLTATSERTPCFFALVPYRLDAVRVGEELWLDYDYRADAFEEATIADWHERFDAIVDLLVRGRAGTVGALLAW